MLADNVERFNEELSSQIKSKPEITKSSIRRKDLDALSRKSNRSSLNKSRRSVSQVKSKSKSKGLPSSIKTRDILRTLEEYKKIREAADQSIVVNDEPKEEEQKDEEPKADEQEDGVVEGEGVEAADEEQEE